MLRILSRNPVEMSTKVHRGEYLSIRSQKMVNSETFTTEVRGKYLLAFKLSPSLVPKLAVARFKKRWAGASGMVTKHPLGQVPRLYLL